MVGFVGNGPLLTTAGESSVYTLAQTVEGFYSTTIPDLDNYTFEGATQVFDCSPPENTPEDIYITPDGLTIFFVGASADSVHKLPLTTAYDLTTAGTVTSFSVASEDAGPQGLHFADDPSDTTTYGKRLYVCGNGLDGVAEYHLTTAWDLSTASFTTGNSISFTNSFLNPDAVRFSKDGSRMFVLSSSFIQQLDLSTPWQVNTAKLTGALETSKFSSVAYEGLAFSSDGKTGYLCATTGDVMQSFHMGSAFDLSNITAITEVTLDTTGNKKGVFISNDNTKFFIVEGAGDKITRYSFG